MKLFWMTVPKPLEGAVGACRKHFMLAAGLSALVNILYLAPTIYMMQVYDRVVPTSGLVTLFWITVVVGLAIGTLSALDGIRGRLMVRASLRLNRLLSSEILDAKGPADGRGKCAAAHQPMRDSMSCADSFWAAALALFDVPLTPIFDRRISNSSLARGDGACRWCRSGRSRNRQ